MQEASAVLPGSRHNRSVLPLLLPLPQLPTVSPVPPALGEPQTEAPALLHEPHGQLHGQEQPLLLAGGGHPDSLSAGLPLLPQEQEVMRGARGAPARVVSRHRPTGVAPLVRSSPASHSCIFTHRFHPERPALSHPAPQTAAQPSSQPLPGDESEHELVRGPGEGLLSHRRPRLRRHTCSRKSR